MVRFPKIKVKGIYYACAIGVELVVDNRKRVMFVQLLLYIANTLCTFRVSSIPKHSWCGYG